MKQAWLACTVSHANPSTLAATSLWQICPAPTRAYIISAGSDIHKIATRGPHRSYIGQRLTEAMPKDAQPPPV